MRNPDIVGERVASRQEEIRGRRSEAARRGAETRRRRREEAAREAAQVPEGQAQGERPTQGNVRARRAKRERRHADLLTVAVRGPLGGRMREIADGAELSLANLLQDMVLVYVGEVEGGYQPGACLARWREQQDA